ncbi:MAG: RdgB/HAM1 family non-canonical purine NTP pyrophosphatase [Chloroflexota bacterium]
MPLDLLLATNNPHKMNEFRKLLDTSMFRVIKPEDIGIALEVAETGETFADNAALKAEAFCTASQLPALADDSGLVVDALGGAPGIYSARYGGPGLSDTDRTHLVLKHMAQTSAALRGARFVAAIALARPGLDTFICEEEVEGVITFEPLGSYGFGYDPIFYYPPAAKTFAEMLAEEKDSVSHRGKAIAKVSDFLRTESANDILR